MIVALLNLTPLNDEEGKGVIRVAVDKIEAINDDDEGDTYIHTVGGGTYYVEETFDEVFQQLTDLLAAVNGADDGDR